MKLKYPTNFSVKYPLENRKYYNHYSQPIIKQALTTASSGHCMYCGNILLNNGKNDGQIEHSIEKVQKGQVVEYLKHCKYNLSLACKTCNTSFKKNVKGINISESIECPQVCNSMCPTYIRNLCEYLEKNQIIVMPSGVTNWSNMYNGRRVLKNHINVKPNGINFWKLRNKFNIEYNLLTMNFEPSSDKTYDPYELNFIWSHIDRFKLNSEDYMPLDIMKVCEHVIKYNDIPHEGDFKNIIADIFIKYLKDEVTFDNIKKVCELIIIMNSL